MGPPFNKSLQSTPSMLQKSTIMKDALLDSTEQPVLVMWKDGTLAFPNLAARKLMEKNATLDKPCEGFDLLSNWIVYSEDFSRKLEPDESPMGVLLRTQTPFTGMRFGIIKQDGTRVVFNALSGAIRDDTTGEFLAGVITCQDVTDMAKEIDQIKERNAERFKLMCDTMPQLVSIHWSSSFSTWQNEPNSTVSSLWQVACSTLPLQVHWPSRPRRSSLDSASQSSFEMGVIGRRVAIVWSCLSMFLSYHIDPLHHHLLLLEHYFFPATD
jgi:hypothetical protein